MADSLDKSEKKLEQKIEKKVEAKVEKDLEKKWAVKNSDLKHEMPKNEVGILIHDYDFLFSDFDPRPLAQRAISDDFLREVRKFTFEESPGIAELRFLVPAGVRNSNSEAIIKKRLRDHFKKHFLEFEKEQKKVVGLGLLGFFSGLGLTVAAGVLVYHFAESNLAAAILISLLEPAGWFIFWTGLDSLIHESKVLFPVLDFYKRMSKADIVFDSY
ncbi:MAG: hypothetical protein Q7R70_00870 [Candidatus Diapherotrites archaeon]|nr:hypothetical protein [Candidatus Diapherotrites archaeon]